MHSRAGSLRAVDVASLALSAVLIAGCASSNDKAGSTIDMVTSLSVTSVASVDEASTTESAPTNTYVVVSGDSLSAIAAASGVSLSALVAANPWSDGAAHVIHPGDLVILPPGATQPGPRQTSTTTSDPPGSDGTAAEKNVDVGGYRLVAPDALLDFDADGTTHSIESPLADGVYYASTYEPTADGSAVLFNLARFSTTEACIDALDTVPEGTVDEEQCYGGSVDTSATTVVTMRLDNEVPVILVTNDYRYLEVKAMEFARLLKGEPPAADAPAWFEFAPYWDAMVEIADGEVVRANQRPSS